jgi:acetyl-CoA carboxylase biotin carboxyl carrier protein
MNYKEIQDLLKFISKSELSEVRIKEGDFEITVRNKHYSKGGKSVSQMVSGPIMHSTPQITESQSVVPLSSGDFTSKSSVQEAEDAKTEHLLEVKSPIVGTFYRSPSPDKPVYVSIGDTISVGSVVCIVEAMKLFNEIESEVAGKIVKVMVEDASPVEYDQVLFLVDPKG